MGYIYLQQKQHKNTAGVAVRGGAQSHGAAPSRGVSRGVALSRGGGARSRGGVGPTAEGVAGEGAESYGGLNVQIALY